MRRLLGVPVLLAAALVATAVPASATTLERHDFVFHAPVPCSIVCPYWTDLDDGSQAACEKEPLAPLGSWDQIELTVPAEIGGRAVQAMRMEIFPEYDYDIVLCRVVGSGTDERYEFVTWGATCLCDPCTGPLGFFGCSDEIDYCVDAGTALCVAPGDRLILRSYNWFDIGDVPGYYEWLGL